MNDPFVTLMSRDERELARIVCTRLAQRLQGLFSVGLGLASADATAARSFMGDRFPDLEAHARVLHTICGGTASMALGDLLQHQAKLVLDASLLLGKQLANEDPFGGDLPRMRSAFSSLCDSLSGYARLVETDPSVIERAQSACLPMFDHLDRTPAPCT